MCLIHRNLTCQFFLNINNFALLTLTYRTNHRKFSGIWAIQVKNLLNQKPDLGYVYNDFNQSVEPVKGMGILPFISYKIEF